MKFALCPFLSGIKTVVRCSGMILGIGMLVLTTCRAQTTPNLQWERARGGSRLDQLFALQQTADGGYIVGGASESGISADKSEITQGDRDFWILKLAPDGSKEWDKTFGASSEDVLYSLQQTRDGGYILGGYTYGAGGDLSGVVRGGSDYWVIKLSADGTKEWDRVFGGDSFEILRGVQQTSDGGYILGGYSNSGISGDKTEDRRGTMQTNDYWVVKISANGTKQWDKTFGGGLNDQLYAIQQTRDGGYIMGGTSTSGMGGDKSETNQLSGEYEYDSDYWIVKIAANGTKQWDRTLGGDGAEDLRALKETSDGGFILGGQSEAIASGDKTEEPKGASDYWVVKLSPAGEKQWDRTIGSASRDELHALLQSPDGSFILAGSSESCACGDKTGKSRGSFDYWVVKLSMNGTTVIWDKTVGSKGADNLRAVAPTSDGGYLLGGYTDAGAGGEKSQVSRGSYDYWIVKLEADQPPLPVTLITFAGHTEGNMAELSWATTSETQSSFFEIQQSTDGKSWNKLGIVNAKGESNSLVSYQYAHARIAAGSKNLYRLRIVDADGKFTYSKIISLTFGEVERVSIYPNPTSEILSFQGSDWKQVRKVELINSRSAVVYSSAKPVRSIDVSRLQPGLYFARVVRKDGTSQLHKVVVAH
ncbi:T9SS type A sorting domain-containing protein [Dyadobacter sandarakinus]|uniref:T9SS type A sorting domain-containing protein n=1 Tax=Dyadobacter sandarakinus TaxID=2747268 RepID=A0ABX7I8E6_9BACT|nr:T9SS type A sorting domain-containing protein [Dyadobacter sandarakinus]QRR02387.1 T9SS type A sorting domain-containing protein [Dyadobacter sandarakinus]